MNGLVARLERLQERMTPGEVTTYALDLRSVALGRPLTPAEVEEGRREVAAARKAAIRAGCPFAYICLGGEVLALRGDAREAIEDRNQDDLLALPEGAPANEGGPDDA
jgi:hypothetical protein